MSKPFKMDPEARRRGLAVARATIASMTPEEDAEITAAAEADPDARPMTDEEHTKARRGRPPTSDMRL